MQIKETLKRQNHILRT